MTTLNKTRRSLFSPKIIGVLFAIFALIAQPLGMLPLPTASAATQIVSTANMQGWQEVDDNGNGGSFALVNGPGNAPRGVGSAQLNVSATNQGYMLYKAGYGGTKLSQINNLGYSTYVQTGNNTIAPSIQMNITADVTAAIPTWQGRLVYEPYMNGTVVDGTWQTWNARAGVWWLSKSATSFGGICGQGSPCTFAQLIAAYPNMGVNTGMLAGIGVKAGSSWSNFVGNFDKFTFRSDVYDFELDPNDPTLQIDSPVANKVNPTTVDVTAHDEEELNRITIRIRDSLNVVKKTCNYNTGAVQDATTSCNIPVLLDGDYTAEAFARDASTRRSDLASVSFSIDKTAPSVPSLVSPSDGAIIKTSDAILDWSEEMDLNGPVTYEYQSSYSSSTTTDNSLSSVLYSTTTGTAHEIDATGSSDGTYYWQARSCDSVGNCSDWSGPWEVTLDSTAPSANAGSDQTLSAVKATTLNGSTDNGSTFKWSVVSGVGTVIFADDTAATTAVSVSEYGSYTFKFVATDTVGNASNPDFVTVTFNQPTQLLLLSTTTNTPASNILNLSAFNRGNDTTSTQPTVSEATTEILGAKTSKKQSAKTPVVEATDSGWNIFGLAWYWWILILAALAGLGWFLARRRNAEN